MDEQEVQGNLFTLDFVRPSWLEEGLKVGVVGWHGHDNFGDEVMLAVIADAVVRGLGRAEIRLLVPTSRLPGFEVPGVAWKGFPPCSSRIVAQLVRCGKIGRAAMDLLKPLFGLYGHLLVFGGGSIFHSPRSIAWKLSIARIHRLVFPRRKRIALGVSLNPTCDRAERLLMKFLNLMDEIVVRDRRSCEVFSRLARSDQKCRVEPDLASRFDWRSGREDIQGLTRIGLFLRKLQDPELQEELESVIFTSLQRVLSTNAEVVVEIYATCADEIFGDLEVSKDFADRIQGTDSSQVVIFDGNPWNFADHLRRLDIVLSMRLHPLVAGEALGAKTIGICDSAKFEDVLGLTSGNHLLLDVDGLTVSELIDGLIRNG